jgi:hypothetical protein
MQLTEASCLNIFRAEPKDPAVQLAVPLLSPSRGAATHHIISRMIHEHP